MNEEAQEKGHLFRMKDSTFRLEHLYNHRHQSEQKASASS